MNLQVPDSSLPRVVIVGGGFGGLQAARKLKNKRVQVVLIDKNNYHQFQPLFYQVAMSGLEAANIVFPLRKVFHNAKNVHVRTASAEKIDAENKILHTNNGSLHYDYLLLAMGTGNNFFGNKKMEENAVGMKSVSEALYLRNRVLEMLEEAANGTRDPDLLHIIIIGAGPTGVELSGALGEMKKHVFPRDYPGIDFSKMRIILMEGTSKVLAAMDEKSGERAYHYLNKLGVEVMLNVRANSFENNILELDNNAHLKCGLVIWAAGVKPNSIQGLPPGSILPGGRIMTDSQLRVKGTNNIYCIGDQSLVEEAAWPKGHPQMAQPAIQAGTLFAKNILHELNGEKTSDFKFKDLGTMATVGRNLAVAELFGLKLGGFLAWIIWMAIHLMAILGVKNKMFIFINWVWSYITYDQSLRLLIKPFKKEIAEK